MTLSAIGSFPQAIRSRPIGGVWQGVRRRTFPTATAAMPCGDKVRLRSSSPFPAAPTRACGHDPHHPTLRDGQEKGIDDKRRGDSMNNGRGWALGGAGLALGILIGYLAGSGPTPNPAEPELLSDLYVQTSGEYHALCEQTYRYAWQSLQDRVKEQPKAGLPLAVVMDLDETVLDNSRYQSRLYQTATTFSR